MYRNVEQQTSIQEHFTHADGQKMWKVISSLKGSLDKNRRSVHEGMKYPCGQCEYQATLKGNLDRHKRAVHQEIKYPCGQCEYQATQNEDLENHRRVGHEGMKYPSGQ